MWVGCPSCSAHRTHQGVPVKQRPVLLRVITCPGDVDFDERVCIDDLLRLLASWGRPCGLADFNTDGDIGIVDLLDLLAHWGSCEAGGPTCSTLAQELDHVCLTPADWDEFTDRMTSGTQQEKANYLCWMKHFLSGCSACTLPPRDHVPGSEPVLINRELQRYRSDPLKVFRGAENPLCRLVTVDTAH